MTVPIFADISAWQPLGIDWVAYRKWAASFDGIARISMRSSYGHGYTDAHFQQYRDGAMAAGVDRMIFYHYAYPQYNRAQDEADWQHRVVGDVRPQDILMLDYEENTNAATAEWAYEWLSRQEQNYSGKLPTVYASDNFVRTRLQDSRLARFPLTLANWQFTPDERPSCPPPWSHYTYLQYTDRASTIPGIAGRIDANVFLGLEEGATMALLPDDPIIQKYYHYANGALTRKDTGASMPPPFTMFYLKNGGPALLRINISSEIAAQDSSGAAIADVSYVIMESCIIIHDKFRKIDRPPTNDECYLLHLDKGPGQMLISNPLVAPLQQQIAQLKQALTVEQQKVAPPDPVLQQKLDNLKALVATM